MTASRRAGARRARIQVERAASEIRAARAEHGLTRAAVSRRAGVSRDTERRVEEGESTVQLDTLCAVGEAVGLDIVIGVYLGRQPTLRDSGQLKLIQTLCALAHSSWDARVELSAGDHGEAVDIGFFGASEILDVEVERLILDFQRQYRRAVQKRDWVGGHHRRPVRLVLAVEDSRRNRAAMKPHLAFIESVLPAGSREVLNALRSGRPLGRDGLLWVRRRQPPRR